MEKKTILAFILSFLVLLAWSLLFTPKQDQVQQKEQEDLKGGPGQPVETVRQSDQASLSVPRSAEGKEIAIGSGSDRLEKREILVETPLYRAIFSNAGPTIKSLKLKNYRKTADPGSPVVDLIDQKTGQDDYILFDFGNSFSNSDQRTMYDVKPRDIRLGLDSSPEDLVFLGTTPEGLSLKQVYRFYPNQYRIDLMVQVVNSTEASVNGTFSAQLTPLPQEKKGYYSYVGLILLMDDKLEQVKIKDTSEEKTFEGLVEWMAYEDDYFISAVIPDNVSKASFKARLLPSGPLHGSYFSPPISVGTSEQAHSSFVLYFGPRDLDVLKQLGRKLDRAVNFGWFDIIAKPLLYLLRLFYRFVGNYGVSIILLTILIKILFWPLTHKSYKSMKEMQKLQPRLAKLREKYKNNREQMNKEMMALYKTYKVNPMGGCLPMVIQIPVFFALFRILGNSIELRHAPFFLWINDLSAPDRLFNFPFKIPFMSPPYGIPILTLLMGASMFIQQKMTPTPGDPTQAKVMMFLPIIFTFMFINFPSGLVLYWLINNILSIGQQYRIHKRSA